MRQPIAFAFFLSLLLFTGVFNGASQQQQYIVSGNVINGVNRRALANAAVELIIKETVVHTDHSNSDGHFSFSFPKLQDFTVRISLNGYTTYTSPVQSFNRSQFNYNLGTIPLSPSQSVKEIVNTDTLIRNKMITVGYVPTQGAWNLFYAMNPSLKGKDQIPSNYSIRYPVLPKFRAFRKTFNKRYKKDKKRNGPYIYTFKNSNDKEDMSFVAHGKNIFENQVYATAENKGAVNSGRFYFAKTKKFVFVFYKIDANNKIQYELKKYRVVYYSEDQKNNPGEYNKSGDATFGYALLSAHIYDVEVYDQANNKRMRLSDDTVDPNEIIQHFDLYKKWNKILIQVYD